MSEKAETAPTDHLPLMEDMTDEAFLSMLKSGLEEVRRGEGIPLREAFEMILEGISQTPGQPPAGNGAIQSPETEDG